MPSNPNRRVKLTLSQQLLYIDNVTQGFQISVTASNGNLMPNEIFLYLRIDPTVGYPNGDDRFQGICTPSQLQVLPINDPDPNTQSRFYRKSSLSITYTTSSDATAGWNAIVEGVKILKSALDFADGMTVTDFWIGTPPGV